MKGLGNRFAVPIFCGFVHSRRSIFCESFDFGKTIGERALGTPWSCFALMTVGSGGALLAENG
jgi:hypothetical protein